MCYRIHIVLWPVERTNASGNMLELKRLTMTQALDFLGVGTAKAVDYEKLEERVIKNAKSSSTFFTLKKNLTEVKLQTSKLRLDKYLNPKKALRVLGLKQNC